MKKKLTNIGLIFMLIFLLAPMAESQQKSLDLTNPIKIGFLNAFTGIASGITVEELAGVTQATEEINAAGGVLGRPLKVITRDDKLNPESGLREAKDLVINEKVFWIQGITSSSVAHAVGDYGKNQKIIVCTDVAKSDKLTEEWGHRYFFRSCATVISESKALVMGSKKIFGPLKKIYNLSPDYEGGRAAWRAFFEFYKKEVPDAKVVGDVWGKLGTQDFTSYLTAIMNSDADMIYTAFYGADAVTMIKQSIALGLNGKIPIVGHWWGTIDITRTLTKDFYPMKTIGCGQYPFWGIDIPESNKFVEKIRSKHNLWPGFAVMSYSFVKAMATAIEKAGSLDTEKVINLLEGAYMDTVIGRVEIRGCDHQAMWPNFVGLIGENPKWGLYGSKNHVRVGSEAYPSCEEISKSRK
jgi:branched-chain amino acid transport system substrate-binding protein